MDHIKLSKVEDVTLVDCFNGYAWIKGVLHITLTQTFFIDSSRKHEIWIETCLIDRVERLPLAATGAPLVIRGKNFRVACFIIRHDRECQEVYETLTRLAQVPSIKHLPCFHEWPSGVSQVRGEGWDLYDLRSDFTRMGLPNASWVILDNSYYQICDTYPNIICMPKQTNRSIILGSANFRSHRRLPTLTWIHPTGKSVLCRSSQPLSGLTSKSADDQLLLRQIRWAVATNSSKAGLTVSEEEPPLLYVIDTRPPLNAITNRAQGKGYEDVGVYRDIILRFAHIPNIHVVRGSLEKMLKAYQNPRVKMKDLHTAVDKSSWLRNLRRLLEAAFFVASRMQPEAGGFSFLVHCSDGWDRTAQVCALAQLLLDPYYRTLDGFQALLEKDWLRFGHKFGERCNQTQAVDGREISPVFTQFLDCTHHLLDLLPTAFQFNTLFLMTLHDHSKSGSFGTFVGCSEKERHELDLSKQTCSSWVYFATKRHLFLNPFYKPPIEYVGAMKVTDRPHVTALLPAFVTSPHLFGLWSDLYLRYEWRIPCLSQRVVGAVNNLKMQTQALTAHSDLLRQRIHELSILLGKTGDEVDDPLQLSENSKGNLSSPSVEKKPADVDCASYHNGSNNQGVSPKSVNINIFPMSDSVGSRLSREVLTRDLERVNTRQVESLIPSVNDCCPVCSVRLVSRTPSILCTHCGKLVCSICYIFSNAILDAATQFPLCKLCHRKLMASNFDLI